MPIVVSHGNVGQFLGAAVGAGAAEESRKQAELALRRAALEQQAQNSLRDDHLRARAQDLDYYRTNANIADRIDHDMFSAEENAALRQADRDARREELEYKSFMDQYNREQDRQHRTDLQFTRGDQTMERTNRRIESQEGMQNTRNQAAMDRLDRRLESASELQGLRGEQAMERVDRRLEGAGWLQDLRAEQRSAMQREAQQDRLDLYEYRFTRQQRQNLENIANSLSMLDQRRESGEITDAVWREGRRRLTGMANAIQPARLPRGTDADGGVSANGHLGVGDRVVAGIPDNVLETLRANPNVRLGSAPGTWVDTESGITWRFNPKSGQSDIVHNRSEDFSRYIELAGRQLQPGAQADQVIARARELYDAALGVSRGRAAANSTGAIPPRRESPPPGPNEDPAPAPPPLPPLPGARPRAPLPTSQTMPLPPRGQSSRGTVQPPVTSATPPIPGVQQTMAPSTTAGQQRLSPELEAAITRQAMLRQGIVPIEPDPDPLAPPPLPVGPPQVSHPGNPDVYDPVRADVENLLNDESTPEERQRGVQRTTQEYRRRQDAAQSTTQATQALDDVIAREMSSLRELEKRSRVEKSEGLPTSGSGLGGRSAPPPAPTRAAVNAMEASRARVAELESVKKDINEAGKLLAAKPFERLSESEQAIVLRAWTRARELQLDEQRGRMGPPAPDPANRVGFEVKQQAPPLPGSPPANVGRSFFGGGVSGIR